MAKLPGPQTTRLEGLQGYGWRQVAENGIDRSTSEGVTKGYRDGCAAASRGVKKMLSWPSDTQLALLLVFCILLVPVLGACLAGFFLMQRSHAGRQRSSGKKKPGDARRHPPDIAGDARAAIDRASYRLVRSAAECSYVFPWTLTAKDADEEIIFTRRYLLDSALRDGLRVEEVVSSPRNTIPRFPVAFRLVDDIGQDITWSIGRVGT
jgi:hypothetical protein